MHQKTVKRNKFTTVRSRKKQFFSVKPVSFKAEGLNCRGRLYLPDGIKNAPVIIMAHGLGAEMSFGIPAYAEKFAANGFAVLTFDYRCFGESEGVPEHYISIKGQLKDWESSIEFVKNLKEIDKNKICIWGFSYSGGHVLITAAKNSNVKAFISHVPFMDSVEFLKKYGFSNIVKADIAGIRDILNSVRGKSPYNIAIVGREDEFAVLNTPESYEGYLSMIPENSEWKNRLPARFVFNGIWYRPKKYIPGIKCRGMVIFAEFDSFTDAALIEKSFKSKKNIELLEFPCGHFMLFEGEYFRKAVRAEIKFLKRVFE